MNSAYKHLDSKLHIGDLTIGQWCGIFAGAITALVYGMYLSPFGHMLTLVSAIYLGGIPIAAVFLASLSEFDFWLLLRSAARWRRRDARFVPGPGAESAGYRLTEAPDDARRAERDRVAELDPTTLWGN